jgi:hypothetical protein
MTRRERTEKARRVVMLAKRARGMVVRKRKGTMSALTGLRSAIFGDRQRPEIKQRWKRDQLRLWGSEINGLWFHLM